MVFRYAWAPRCCEEGRPASVECSCGRRLVRKGRAWRPVRTALDEVDLTQRLRCRCPACGRETVLGEEIRGQGDFQELAVRLLACAGRAVGGTVAEAAKTTRRMLGFEVAPKTVQSVGLVGPREVVLIARRELVHLAHRAEAKARRAGDGILTKWVLQLPHGSVTIVWGSLRALFGKETPHAIPLQADARGRHPRPTVALPVPRPLRAEAEVRCAACGKALKCPANAAGKFGKCSGCGAPIQVPTSVPSQGQTPSAPPAAQADPEHPKSRLKRIALLGCGTIIAAYVVVLVAWFGIDLFGGGGGPGEEKAQGPGFEEHHARYFAEEYVKEKLKAPSTASFPWSDSEWQVVDLGGGKWRVSSYVDAGNAFGAKLRKRFVVVMQVEGEKGVPAGDERRGPERRSGSSRRGARGRPTGTTSTSDWPTRARS